MYTLEKHYGKGNNTSIPLLSPATEGAKGGVSSTLALTPNDQVITGTKGMNIQEALDLAKGIDGIIWNPHLIVILARKCKTLAEVKAIPGANELENKALLFVCLRILILTDQTFDEVTKLRLIDIFLEKLIIFSPTKGEVVQNFKNLTKGRGIPKSIKRKLSDFRRDYA